MKRYTDAFFIHQVQSFYKEHHRLPKTRDFSWGSTALRRFGSWGELLDAAELMPRNPANNDTLKRKKDQLRTELLHLTYNEGWHNDAAKVQQVNWLRKQIDKINEKR